MLEVLQWIQGILLCLLVPWFFVVQRQITSLLLVVTKIQAKLDNGITSNQNIMTERITSLRDDMSSFRLWRERIDTAKILPESERRITDLEKKHNELEHRIAMKEQRDTDLHG